MQPLPNPFVQSLVVFRFEFLKHAKSRKIIGSISISVAVSVLGFLSPELLGFENISSRTFLSFPLGVIHVFLVLIVTLSGSNSLNSEFTEKTGYSLFTNPVGKNSIWLGKFIASEIICFLMIALYFVILTIGTAIFYDQVPLEIFYSLIFSLVAITAYMGITFFISSVFKGATASAVFVFFLLLMIIPLIDQMLIGVQEIKPWFSPTFSEQIIENILIKPYPSDLDPGQIPRGPFDVHRFVPYVAESLLVLLCYAAVFGSLSLLFFQKRELA